MASGCVGIQSPLVAKLLLLGLGIQLLPSARLYVYGEIYSGGGRELPQLYLKDGTINNVTDYWLVNNQLHFTTIDESGTKWVEHTIDFDQLDLQKTVDVSAQRGFRLVLRDEPMQQYLQDHPEIGEPDAPPPGSAQPPLPGTPNPR